ncbi:MAG: flavodoxin family protein [Tissierellia bacterium]|nr:flavodoxin family protein [Tissierellia bacterium]
MTMKITCITGTDIKGCTYQIKEFFLKEFSKADIKEFYLPSQGPDYCTGCKNCFTKGESFCPHVNKVTPIWEAMLVSDLIVFAYPVYVLRAPGQVKSLLDHLGCHWFAHRPDPRMFSKRGAIITQSIGAPNSAAQKDVKTSLNWLGVSSVKCLGIGLMDGVVWEDLSKNRREKIKNKLINFAASFKNLKPASMSPKVKLIFKMCQSMQRSIEKKGIDSLDLRYWRDSYLL